MSETDEFSRFNDQRQTIREKTRRRTFKEGSSFDTLTYRPNQRKARKVTIKEGHD